MVILEANEFHISWTCPVCDHHFSDGEMLAVCDECGIAHHESCCASTPLCHICNSVDFDAAVEAPEPAVSIFDDINEPPEVSVSVNEVRAVPTILPTPPSQSPEEVVAEFVSKPSTGGKWFNVVAVVAAAMSLLVIPGSITNQMYLIVIGCVMAFLGIIVGIVAGMLDWSNRKVRVTTVCALIISYASILGTGFASYGSSEQGMPTLSSFMDFDLSAPTEEQLASLPPSIANALRANVLIKHDSPLQQSFGSGVVTRVGEDNVFILTNKHVLGDGNITVKFHNGDSSDGEIVWLAPGDIDLAYISCEVHPQLTYGSIPVYSGLLKPGDETFAVGNPMNLPWTYTSGVVSSVRTQHPPGGKLHIYQTQTPINKGNSGGGLCTKSGELVGINTWTQDKAFSEAISFSISSYSLLGLLSEGGIREYIETVVQSDILENQTVLPDGKETATDERSP